MKFLTRSFLFLLLLTFSFGANAQISIGPKLGLNIATLGGDAEDAKPVVGVQVGVTAEIPVSEKVSFQPELLFFQKGASDDEAEIDVLLNYIEIPLLAKIKFGDGESNGFFATVGPSFGFGQKIKFKADGDSFTTDFDDSDLKKFDLGLSLGFGTSFAAGPGSIFVDARFLLGLTNILDDESEDKTMNRGVGIAAGYLFPIGG